MSHAPTNRRRFLKLGAAGLVWPFLPTPAFARAGFKPVHTQFIASLAAPTAKSGTGAETWGLWRLDPGPRGVRLRHYEYLVANGGIAPAQWKFDANDWWLEENGLIMEPPEFGMPPGRYLVTGDREVMTVLTIHPKDAKGNQNWDLADNANIYDVTHLRCRSSRYRPIEGAAACAPSQVQQKGWPVSPDIPMPEVSGCTKQDYAVLFIVGVEA